MENKVKINRGDIFFVVLSGEGSVQKGKRPVVVISNELNNTYSTVVNVVPCTTKLKNLPVHANLSSDCGLNRKSQALCEQVCTIPKDSLVEYVGKATDNDLREINKALAIQMGLFGEGENLLHFVLGQKKVLSDKKNRITPFLYCSNTFTLGIYGKTRYITIR